MGWGGVGGPSPEGVALSTIRFGEIRRYPSRRHHPHVGKKRNGSRVIKRKVCPPARIADDERVKGDHPNVGRATRYRSSILRGERL